MMNQGKALLTVIIVLDALMLTGLPIFPYSVQIQNPASFVNVVPQICSNFAKCNQTAPVMSNSTGLSVSECYSGCYKQTVRFDTLWGLFLRTLEGQCPPNSICVTMTFTNGSRT